MKSFMIKFNKIILLIFFSFIYLILNGCSNTTVSWKARDLGCHVPSANMAFLEIMQLQQTGTKQDLGSLLKYVDYTFKKSILNLDDRCKHSQLIIKALYSGEDLKPYAWNSQYNNTDGKIIIFSSREYVKKICRDYYSYISSKQKKYVWKGTACMGSKDVLAPEPDLISKVDDWYFYHFYNSQNGSNPLKNKNLLFFSNPVTKEIRMGLSKFRSKIY